MARASAGRGDPAHRPVTNSGVILDQEWFLQSSRPGTENVVPVADVVKVNAVSPNLSRDRRQEAEKNLRFVEGIAGANSCSFLPSCKRSLPESRMNREMVNP